MMSFYPSLLRILSKANCLNISYTSPFCLTSTLPSSFYTTISLLLVLLRLSPYTLVIENMSTFFHNQDKLPFSFHPLNFILSLSPYPIFTFQPQKSQHSPSQFPVYIHRVIIKIIQHIHNNVIRIII